MDGVASRERLVGEDGNISFAYDLSRNPFEMPWYFAVIYIVLYTSMVGVAVVGNACVVYIIVSSPAMRNVTNYFIVNLSVSDTILALFNVLFVMIYLIENDWIFGEWYCKLAQFLAPFMISASIFTYVAIAIDRYMAIVHPLRPKLTSRQIIITIVSIWVVSGAIGTPNFVHARLIYFEADNRIVCTPVWPDGVRSTSDKVYNVFLIVANYIIPLIVVATSYFKVCTVLWGSKVVGERNVRQEECIKAKRKLVKMMIFCVVIFATCWAPMHTYQVASYLFDQVTTWRYINYVYPIIYLIAMSNTMYPPIVYSRLNARFRYGFARILKRCCCLSGGHSQTRMVANPESYVNQQLYCFDQASAAGHMYLRAVASRSVSLNPFSLALAPNLTPRPSFRYGSRAPDSQDRNPSTNGKKMVVNYNIRSKKINLTATVSNST